MTRRMNRTFLAALTLLAMLSLLTPAALADGGPAVADDVTVGEDGTVTLISSHVAGDEVSSVQLKLDTSADPGTASFTFDGGLSGRITRWSGDDVLNIYIAGTAPLMSPGQTELVLGTVSGVAPENVKLVVGSLEYVYGKRMIAQNFEPDTREDGPDYSGGSAGAQLAQALEMAGTYKDMQSQYTAASWEAFMQAYMDAQSLAEDADEEELLAAAERLANAISGLVPVSGTSSGGRSSDQDAALDELLEEAKGKLSGSYTQDSLAALQEAIQAVEDAQDSGDADALADASAKLEAALKKLVPTASADSNGPTIADGPQMEGDGGTDTSGTATPVPTSTAVPADNGRSRAPDTGDGTALLPWTMTLCLSGGLLAAMLLRRKSWRTEK